MVYDPFSILWSSIWSSLLRIFTPNNHQKYWPVVFFFRLWYQGNAGLIILGVFTPLKFSGRGWEELALVHCYMFGRIHQWSHLFTVFGSYMITDSVSSLVCSNSLSAWFRAGGLHLCVLYILITHFLHHCPLCDRAQSLSCVRPFGPQGSLIVFDMSMCCLKWKVFYRKKGGEGSYSQQNRRNYFRLEDILGWVGKNHRVLSCRLPLLL